MVTAIAAQGMQEITPKVHYINGEAVSGEGAPLKVIFPATGETMLDINMADARQLEQVIAAAQAAFDSGIWRNKPAAVRAKILEAMADYLWERREKLAVRLVLDNGKTYREAIDEVGGAVVNCRYAAKYCLMDEGKVLPPERGLTKFIWREPVGVVLGVLPFNAPLFFAALKAAPALAAGNSVILKSSSRTPLLAAALCEAAEASGVPAGVLNAVNVPRDMVMDLCEDPRINLITLTGGNAAGSQMIQASVSTFKRLMLELGGKSAHIVMADADLEAAIPGVATGIYLNSGQRCFSGTRLVVEEAVADQVEEGIIKVARSLAVGNPFDDMSQVGAMIDMNAVESAEAFIRTAATEGLEIGTGGKRIEELQPGSFFQPTVLLNATADSFAAQEEIFAPVLTVIRVKDEEEAVAVANNSRFGLAGGVWTRDIGKAMRIAQGVRTGYFWVNTYAAVLLDMPFGGYKHSGIGREIGKSGYEAYTELKTVIIDTNRGGMPPVFNGLPINL